MRLEIEVGQKAFAIAGHSHSFKDGEEIEFVKYGNKSEKEDYYEYVFYSEKDNLQQWLVPNEFELKEAK